MSTPAFAALPVLRSAISGSGSVTGTAKGESIYGSPTNDVLNGRGGNDFLFGYGGNDTLIGGDGYDVAYFDGFYAEFAISYGAIAGRLTVTDSVTGRSGVDVCASVEYFAFADGIVLAQPKAVGQLISGTSADETLVGGPSDDSLISGSGIDVLIGGGGNDVLFGNGRSTVVFTGNFSEYTITLDPVVGEYFVADSVPGRDGIDSIYPDFGNLQFADRSLSLKTNGPYYGSADADRLDGTLGNDLFMGKGGDDRFFGYAGEDGASFSGYFADYVITFNAANATYTVADKVQGRDGSDVLSDIEVLYFRDNSVPVQASPGGQVIIGDGSSFQLEGGPGNDSLIGGSDGSYVLMGGAGDDSLSALNIGTAVYRGAFAEYVISLETEDGNGGSFVVRDKVAGRDGTDRLMNISFLQFADATIPIGVSDGGESITGTNGPDTLTGGPGYDSIDGGPGNDDVKGGNGGDVLRGGDGDDRLDGGAANDWLIGGYGDDTLYGRAGQDTAVYSGNRAEYQIAYNPLNRSYQITDTVADRDGVDVLGGIEFVQFADGTWSVGPTAGATALVGIDPLIGADVIA